jgi:hypothetical protein
LSRLFPSCVFETAQAYRRPRDHHCERGQSRLRAQLGADEVIDYNACDFAKVVSNCDAVFDTVGGDVAQRSFAVLKPGGRAAFIASGAQAPQPARGDVTSLRPPVGRAGPVEDDPADSQNDGLWNRQGTTKPGHAGVEQTRKRPGMSADLRVPTDRRPERLPKS